MNRNQLIPVFVLALINLLDPDSNSKRTFRRTKSQVHKDKIRMNSGIFKCVYLEM
jgi:hypothetical protein